MSALLTYRSRDSFEVRFGRNIPDPSRRQNINGVEQNEHWAIHNDGHRNAGPARPSSASEPELRRIQTPESKKAPTYFSAQSYLRYQGEKFIKRYDANCYIAITRKLDTHDVSRDRVTTLPSEADPVERLHAALGLIEQPTLILGIKSDGLFTFAEQQELAAGIPNARLEVIESSEGHDAFLLEFEQVNAHLIRFMNETLTDIMKREADEEEVEKLNVEGEPKKSMVSEVDDITAW
jgi:homoserine O-acetyltransferase